MAEEYPYVLVVQIGNVSHRFKLRDKEQGYNLMAEWTNLVKTAQGKQIIGSFSVYPRMTLRFDAILCMSIEDNVPSDYDLLVKKQAQFIDEQTKKEPWQESNDS